MFFFLLYWKGVWLIKFVINFIGYCNNVINIKCVFGKGFLKLKNFNEDILKEKIWELGENKRVIFVCWCFV